MPANTTFSAPHIPYNNLNFYISYINIHLCSANGVLHLKLPSICHTSGLVFSCHCRFRFLGLSFNFLSPSVTLTDYQPYIHTSSYSPSVLFSWLFYLRLIIHAKIAERLNSVGLLPVSSFLNAISWLTCGRMLFRPPLLQLWAFGNLNNRWDSQNSMLYPSIKQKIFVPCVLFEEGSLFTTFKPWKLHRLGPQEYSFDMRYTKQIYDITSRKSNIVACNQNCSATPHRLYQWLNTKVIFIWPMHYFRVCHIIITKAAIIFVTVQTDFNS